MCVCHYVCVCLYLCVYWEGCVCVYVCACICVCIGEVGGGERDNKRCGWGASMPV